MTANEFFNWRRRLGLTQSGAAKALDRGLRSVQKYESGQQEIPYVVELACRWIEANS